jgi:hypothetical protein
MQIEFQVELETSGNEVYLGRVTDDSLDQAALGHLVDGATSQRAVDLQLLRQGGDGDDLTRTEKTRIRKLLKKKKCKSRRKEMIEMENIMNTQTTKIERSE